MVLKGIWTPTKCGGIVLEQKVCALTRRQTYPQAINSGHQVTRFGTPVGTPVKLSGDYSLIKYTDYSTG